MPVTLLSPASPSADFSYQQQPRPQHRPMAQHADSTAATTAGLASAALEANSEATANTIFFM
jgi:hypothetical protein